MKLTKTKQVQVYIYFIMQWSHALDTSTLFAHTKYISHGVKISQTLCLIFEFYISCIAACQSLLVHVNDYSLSTLVHEALYWQITATIKPCQTTHYTL